MSIRIDPLYNLPEHRSFERLLNKLNLHVLPLGSPAIAMRIIEGRITPQEECYSEDPLDPIFLRAQNIEEGYLNFESTKRLKKEDFNAKMKAILQDGDIVLTIDGALLGKAAVHRGGEDPCCVSNHMVRIIHGPDVTPDYLSWVLNSPIGQKQIKRGTTGSAIPGIRTDAIERILIPLPIIDIQEKLVAEIERARHSRKKKLQQADELLNSLDEWLYTRLKITSNNSNRRKVFSVRYRQLQGPLNPERYAAAQTQRQIGGTTVGQICEILAEKISPSKVAPTKVWDRIRIDDLPNQPLQINILNSTNGSEIDGSFFVVRENDILLARLGPTILNAKFVLCPPLKRQTVASAEFLVLRCKEGWRPEVVLWILRTRLFRDIMYSLCRGGTPSRYRLNAEDLAQMTFPVISDLKQRAITKEIQHRRETVLLLRSEAEDEWQAAKQRFEDQLLRKEATSKAKNVRQGR